jgi:hypothetical protein
MTKLSVSVYSGVCLLRRRGGCIRLSRSDSRPPMDARSAGLLEHAVGPVDTITERRVIMDRGASGPWADVDRLTSVL